MISCQAFRARQADPVENLTSVRAVADSADVAQGRKNPLWMGLPDRLSRIRKKAGLSPRQVALLSNVGKNLPNLIENGVNRPGIDIVERIAAGLGVPVGWLAYGWEGFAHFQKKAAHPVIPYDEPEPGVGNSTFGERFLGCGKRLRFVREQMGLTLRELEILASDEKKVSHASFSLIENGAMVPRVNTLEAIAHALRVPPCWLAYGEEE